MFVRCAWSEGGDSLLDSEEECEGSGERGCGVEKIGESKEERSGKLSLQSSLSSGPPAPASPPPQSTPPPDDAITSPKKSRVIRLDSKRSKYQDYSGTNYNVRCLPVEFRYVSDSLPDVPLPKRTMSRKKPVITRPRRITSNNGERSWYIPDMYCLFQNHPCCWNQGKCFPLSQTLTSGTFL